MSNRRTLIVDTVEVPLLEDATMPITYSIEDIRNPDKTNASFAETVELPASQELETFFENIENPAIDLQLFNPNLKTDVIYRINNTDVFTGYLKLIKAMRNRETNNTKYIADFIGQKMDLFFNMGDKFFVDNADPADDLDFSAYDHTLNLTNVVNSWSASNGAGYKYKLLDYGYSGSGTNGGSDTNFKINHLRPLLYVRQILNEIFIGAGKTWTSVFLDSNFFKTLMVSCNEEIKMNSSDLLNRSCWVGVNGISATNVYVDYTMVYTSGTTHWDSVAHQDETILWDDKTTPLLNDNGNMYTIATGVFTMPVTAVYDFTFVFGVEINFYNTTNPGLALTTLDMTFSCDLQKYVGGSWVTVNNLSTEAFTGINYLPLFLINQNLQVSVTAGDLYRVTYATGVTDVGLLTNIGGTLTTANGGVTYYQMKVVNLVSNLDNTVKVTPYNQTILEGDTVEATQCLPKNLKQKDFFKSIIQMFNLQVMEDKNNTNNYIIEPYITFFNGTVRDWTSKLDITKGEEIILMGELDAKKYVRDMKSDSDYFNRLYQDNWKRNFGYSETVIENQFLLNENKIEIAFSSTPLVSKLCTYGDYLIIPHIYKKQANTIELQSSNTRILIDGGMINGRWNLVDSTGSNYQTTYPYAGTLDNPYTPTFDLNFGLPNEIYINTSLVIAYPLVNLTSVYWKPFIDRISDKNSKILKAYINLDEIDIKLFDFREPVLIDGVMYTVNLIDSFELTDPKSQLVEFLKL